MGNWKGIGGRKGFSPKLAESFADKLFNFRTTKFTLFMQVGNMEDINKMSYKDFCNLVYYLNIKTKKENKEPVPILDGQKEMIKRLREMEKNG